MLHNIQLEVDIVLAGGASMMEHPAPPLQESYASTWRTGLQRQFCSSHPTCQHIQLQQWRVGADAVKPTTLRVLGLPPVAHVFHAHALQGVSRPTEHLMGIQTDSGAFKTARAKEYPAQLCKAMIDTLLTGLHRRRQRHGLAPQPLSQLGERDQKWLQHMVEMSSQCTAETFLPDYQPLR